MRAKIPCNISMSSNQFLLISVDVPCYFCNLRCSVSRLPNCNLKESDLITLTSYIAETSDKAGKNPELKFSLFSSTAEYNCSLMSLAYE